MQNERSHIAFAGPFGTTFAFTTSGKHPSLVASILVGAAFLLIASAVADLILHL